MYYCIWQKYCYSIMCTVFPVYKDGYKFALRVLLSPFLPNRLICVRGNILRWIFSHVWFEISNKLQILSPCWYVKRLYENPNGSFFIRYSNCVIWDSIFQLTKPIMDLKTCILATSSCRNKDHLYMLLPSHRYKSIHC